MAKKTKTKSNDNNELNMLDLLKDSNTIEEDNSYLTEQIITYIGNKRSLLNFIGLGLNEIQTKLKKTKLDCTDLFSGSGIVSRYLKRFSKNLYVNDLEDYCFTLNNCYLKNKSEVDFETLIKNYEKTTKYVEQNIKPGFITKLYSPKNDKDIKKGERVFYTTRNASYIDTARQYIENIKEPYKTLLLAPLLYEASVHNNTSGVFKGFYKNSKTGIGQFGGNGKNALSRIMSNIELKVPIFSNFECNINIFQKDSSVLAKELPRVDLTYIDPPYNQHPYGSNYFMLNLINNYIEPKEISNVSGIPVGWNKSQFNKKSDSKEAMKKICKDLNSKFLLISFNSEGFISNEEMIKILNEIGDVKVLDINYNTFRGSRNLNSRDIHVKEYLYLVDKR